MLMDHMLDEMDVYHGKARSDQIDMLRSHCDDHLKLAFRRWIIKGLLDSMINQPHLYSIDVRFFSGDRLSIR